MSTVNAKSSSCSYEKYMKDQLELLSKNFVIKCYKRVNIENWQCFDKEVDRLVQIRWKDKVIYEFITEKSFWFQRNTNKEDKVYMRKHADEKIKMLSAGIVKRTSKSIPVKTKPQVKQKIGHSQTLFENAKK
jgi:hypothetical protein